MTSKAHLQYFEKLNSNKMRFGLGAVSSLLKRLDNPHNKYKSILIGGTNGKGSVAATVASILTEEGYNVGLYTSPHLIDFRERIRLNNNMITYEDLCELIGEIRKAVKEDVTYFEFATALAFLYFYLNKVDIAVLEVGLGGRLDATNLVNPELSVITNISREHQHYLGKDLRSIAREKGGIIKDNGICLTAAKQPVVLEVIERMCKQHDSEFYVLGRDMKIRASRNGDFSYKGLKNTFKKLHTPLMGRHQIDNASLALASLEILRSKGFAVESSSIIEGLQNVKWEGRGELVCDNPRVIVDGAHNPAGMSALCRWLSTDIAYRRLILLFGVLKDKDYTTMMKKIAPLADKIIITSPGGERAVLPEQLLPAARRYHTDIEIVNDPKNALDRAFELARNDDLICVAGSLYLAGEIKKSLQA